MTDAVTANRTTIAISDVLELVGRWWWNYDEAHFDVLTDLLADDAHFTCRTDTGKTDYEEFVNADVRGHDDVMAWQREHRLDSPYPLRHNGTDVHIADDATTRPTRVVHLRDPDRRRRRVEPFDRDRAGDGAARRWCTQARRPPCRSRHRVVHDAA